MYNMFSKILEPLSLTKVEDDRCVANKQLMRQEQERRPPKRLQASGEET